MSHTVITANRLSDGVVVWRDAAGNWAEPFERAALIDAPVVEATLAQAKADVQRRLVVGVYSVPVTLRDGKVAPQNVREAIRSHGPTVRRDLGIQARLPIGAD